MLLMSGAARLAGRIRAFAAIHLAVAICVAAAIFVLAVILLPRGAMLGVTLVLGVTLLGVGAVPVMRAVGAVLSRGAMLGVALLSRLGGGGRCESERQSADVKNLHVVISWWIGVGAGLSGLLFRRFEEEEVRIPD
jgi:hypothetical protein